MSQGTILKGVSQEVFEKGLDHVFRETELTEKDSTPGFCMIEDVFKVKKHDSSTRTEQEMSGVGRFRRSGEAENIETDQIEEQYKTVYTPLTWTNGVDISLDAQEDDIYGAFKNPPKDLKEAALDTQYAEGFKVYQNAFDTNYVGADSKPLCATDHPRAYGGTLNNKLTEKFGVRVLDKMIQRLNTQRSHERRVITQAPKVLLCSPYLYTYCCEIVKSKFRPRGNFNEPNIFNMEHTIKVVQSPYLSSTETGNSAHDHMVFLLSGKHHVSRIQRIDLHTWYIPWNLSNNGVSRYNARYREVYGWSSPIGVVGTDGTTGDYDYKLA